MTEQIFGPESVPAPVLVDDLAGVIAVDCRRNLEALWAVLDLLAR